jgi:hypothetical protein
MDCGSISWPDIKASGPLPYVLSIFEFSMMLVAVTCTDPEAMKNAI